MRETLALGLIDALIDTLKHIVTLYLNCFSSLHVQQKVQCLVSSVQCDVEQNGYNLVDCNYCTA